MWFGVIYNHTVTVIKQLSLHLHNFWFLCCFFKKYTYIYAKKVFYVQKLTRFSLSMIIIKTINNKNNNDNNTDNNKNNDKHHDNNGHNNDNVNNGNNNDKSANNNIGDNNDCNDNSNYNNKIVQ